MMIINQKQKEIKMKIITSIITVSLIAIGTTLFAQSSTNLLGNTYYHSDGSSTSLLGNTYYNSNGSSTSLLGNSYYNSNGSSTSRLGNSYYHSDGSSTTRIGNTYYNSSYKRTPTYILKDYCYPCK